MSRDRRGFYNVELLLVIVAVAVGVALGVSQHSFLWFFLGALGGPILLLSAGALAGLVGHLTNSAEKEARANRKKLIELGLRGLPGTEAKGDWLFALNSAEHNVAMAAHGVEPEVAAAADAAWDRVAPKAYEALAAGEGDKLSRMRTAQQLLGRFDRLAKLARVSREFLEGLIPRKAGGP